MKQRVLAVVLGLCVTASFAATESARVKTTVDWEQFIGKQDLYWKALPQNWMEAPFIGNGLMGSMLFQEDRNSLVIQIGRADVQDHRAESGKFSVNKTLPDQSRLPIGYFTLDTAGTIQGCDLRLDLWDAEVSGTMATDKGKIALTALVHSEQNLLVVEAKADAGEAGFTYTWHPEEAFCPRVRGKRHGGKTYLDAYVGNPAPVIEEAGDLHLCVQELLAGGQTVTAWTVRTPSRHTKVLYASVGHSFPGSTARAEASSVVEAHREIRVEELQRSHRTWWHAFYPRSFVSLPDARMESFFWIQHYKMACATKGGRAIADNQGPWLQPTSWPALWWNLNVQLAYSHMLPANHPALSVGLLEHLVKHRDHLSKNVPDEMRTDSIALNTVSGQDLLSPMGAPLVDAGVSVGNMTWAMHNCYMQYRYTMDEAMLREKIYPLLKKSINYYRHSFIEGEDGRIHLPVTASPEYGHAADCNYDLALLRWGCRTLIESAERLGIDDPLLPAWRDILERLVDYPQDETGFLIGKDVPYAKSHRHYSHLLMFYPLAIMDLEDPETRALAKQSLLHWQSLPEKLAGYSYSGSSSMFSLLGDGRMAEQRLQDFLDDKILVNTFYKEGVSNPVIETPPAAARAIEDMLIQSWGDRIRVFPAVPETWPEVAFADLRTEGAFLVSALRTKGKTAFIAIKSLAGQPCRIQTGIEGEIKVVGTEADAVRQRGGGVVEMRLPKDAGLILADASYDGNYAITPVQPARHRDWVWGK